jgi:hypothetical protein
MLDCFRERNELGFKGLHSLSVEQEFYHLKEEEVGRVHVSSCCPVLKMF